MKVIFTIFIISQFINVTYAFKLGIHSDRITKPALRTKDFDEYSQDVVAYYNVRTDILEQTNSAAHADGNDLGGASLRLNKRRNLIVDKLKSCDKRSAMINLGQALHTVQDIYSHSNTIDNGHSIDLLGMGNGPRLIEGQPVCNNFNGFSPNYLVTGHFSLSGAAFGLLNSNPLAGPTTLDEGSCRGYPLPVYPLIGGLFGGAKLGECCHQFLNKDNESQVNQNFNAAFLAAVSGTQEYVDLIFEKIDEDVQISKDDALFYKNMLRKIQKRIVYLIDTTGSMEDDIVQLKQQINSDLDGFLLNRESPNLGLITFKDEGEVETANFECVNIEDFRTHINDIEVLGGDDCEEASGEALEDALGLFQEWYSVPDQRMNEGRTIFLSTDASASNPDLVERVKNIARVSKISVDSLITGTCEEEFSEKDITDSFIPSSNRKGLKVKSKKRTVHKATKPILSGSSYVMFQSLADQTGGVSFQVNKDEIGSILPIYTFMKDIGTETIFIREISKESGSVSESIIEIDDSMTNGNAVFMIKTIDRTSELPIVEIINPAGTLVTNSDQVSVTIVSSMIVYEIDFPEVGEWKIRLSNVSSNYLIKVFAETEFAVSKISFFNAPDNPNLKEVELIQTERDLIVGEELTLHISMTAPPLTLNIELHKKNEEIIEKLQSSLVDGSLRTYKSTFNVPNEDFHIKISGEFQNGLTFNREVSKNITPKKVKLDLQVPFFIEPYHLVLPIDFLKYVPASSQTFQLLITNNDIKESSYTLTAYSKSNYLISIQNEIIVPSDDSISVPVTVSLPESAIIGSIDELLFIVQDINNSTNNNYTTSNILIESDLIFVNAFE